MYQRNKQIVPQFGCSIGKSYDSKLFLFFVVSLINTGDTKMRIWWKTAVDMLDGSRLIIMLFTGKVNCSILLESGVQRIHLTCHYDSLHSLCKN